MDDNERQDESLLDPSLLLLPRERRPWTGIDEEVRFFPQRLVEIPHWLTKDEPEIVCRRAWDDCLRLLREEGYLALRGLETQLSERLKRQQAERQRFGALLREANEDWEQLYQAAERFGTDSLAEEAAGKEGWKRDEIKGPHGSVSPSAVVWAPEEYNEGRRIPLSVKIGLTWKEELQDQREYLDDLDARMTTVNNVLHVLAFRHSVCSEVLRHYEVYGLTWNWDELGESDTVELDPTDLELAAKLLDPSKRLAYIDEVLFPRHYNSGGWPAIASGFKSDWKRAGLKEEDLPYKSADPDEMNRKHGRYRARKGGGSIG